VVLVTQNESHFEYANKIISLDDQELKEIPGFIDKNDTNVDTKTEELHLNQSLSTKWEESDERTSLLSTKKIYSEEIKSGQVSFTTYKRYLKAGGLFFFLGAVFFWASTQILG